MSTDKYTFYVDVALGKGSAQLEDLFKKIKTPIKLEITIGTSLLDQQISNVKSKAKDLGKAVSESLQSGFKTGLQTQLEKSYMDIDKYLNTFKQSKKDILAIERDIANITTDTGRAKPGQAANLKYLKEMRTAVAAITSEYKSMGDAARKAAEEARQAINRAANEYGLVGGGKGGIGANVRGRGATGDFEPTSRFRNNSSFRGTDVSFKSVGRQFGSGAGRNASSFTTKFQSTGSGQDYLNFLDQETAAIENALTERLKQQAALQRKANLQAQEISSRSTRPGFSQTDLFGAKRLIDAARAEDIENQRALTSLRQQEIQRKIQQVTSRATQQGIPVSLDIVKILAREATFRQQAEASAAFGEGVGTFATGKGAFSSLKRTLTPPTNTNNISRGPGFNGKVPQGDFTAFSKGNVEKFNDRVNNLLEQERIHFGGPRPPINGDLEERERAVGIASKTQTKNQTRLDTNFIRGITKSNSAIAKGAAEDTYITKADEQRLRKLQLQTKNFKGLIEPVLSKKDLEFKIKSEEATLKNIQNVQKQADQLVSLNKTRQDIHGLPPLATLDLDQHRKDLRLTEPIKALERRANRLSSSTSSVTLNPINSVADLNLETDRIKQLEKASTASSKGGFVNLSDARTERQKIERANKELDKFTPEELRDPVILNNFAKDKGIPLHKLDIAGANRVFNPKRLFNPETLIQLGFAGAFGGIPSLIGGAIGGSTKAGAGGAVFGSTFSQALVSTLFDPVKEAFVKFSDEFKEAGIAFNRSILGISAVNQANTTFTEVGGKSLPIDQQLKLQSGRARQTQIAARSKLLPLGIAGQTEATFVQGIVSALAQRGFQATPEQIAKISELTGGAIQSQRPGLLENSQLLLRDLQDVFGGGPQAKRTILSQLIRPALGGIQNAKNAGDVVSALEKGGLGGFVEAAKGLDNPVVQLNKLSGALDLLKTNAGDKFLDALSPALKRFIEALDPATESGKKINDLAENLGSAFGEISGSFTDLQKNILQFSSSFKDEVPKIASAITLFQKQIPGIATSLAGLLGGIALLNAGPITGLVGSGLGAVGGLFSGGGAGLGNKLSNSLFDTSKSSFSKAGNSFEMSKLALNLQQNSRALGTSFTGQIASSAASGIGQGVLGVGAGALGAIVASAVPIAAAVLIGGPLLRELIDASADAIEQKANKETDDQNSIFAKKGEERRKFELSQTPQSKVTSALAALNLTDEAQKDIEETNSLPGNKKKIFDAETKKLLGTDQINLDFLSKDFIGPLTPEQQQIKNAGLPQGFSTFSSAKNQNEIDLLKQKQSFLLPGLNSDTDIESSNLDLQIGQAESDKLEKSIKETQQSIQNQKDLSQKEIEPKEKKRLEQSANDARTKLEQISKSSDSIESLRNTLNQALKKARPSRAGKFDFEEATPVDQLSLEELSSQGALTDDQRKDILKITGKDIGTAADAFNKLGLAKESNSTKYKTAADELNTAQESLSRKPGEVFQDGKEGKLEVQKSQAALDAIIQNQKIDNNSLVRLRKNAEDLKFGESGSTPESRAKLSGVDFNSFLSERKLRQGRLESFGTGPFDENTERFKKITQEQIQNSIEQFPAALEKLVSGNGQSGLARQLAGQQSSAGAESKAKFAENQAGFNIQTIQGDINTLKQASFDTSLTDQERQGIGNQIKTKSAQLNDANADRAEKRNSVFEEFINKLKAASVAFDNLNKGINEEFANRAKLLKSNEGANNNLFEFVQGRRGRELNALQGNISLGQQFKSLTGGLNGNLPSEALAALQSPDLAKDLQRQSLEEQISASGRSFDNLPKTEQEQQAALQGEITKNIDALYTLTDATNKLRDTYAEARDNALGITNKFTGADVLSQTSLDKGATPLGNTEFDTAFNAGTEKVKGKLPGVNPNGRPDAYRDGNPSYDPNMQAPLPGTGTQSGFSFDSTPISSGDLEKLQSSRGVNQTDPATLEAIRKAQAARTPDQTDPNIVRLNALGKGPVDSTYMPTRSSMSDTIPAASDGTMFAEPIRQRTINSTAGPEDKIGILNNQFKGGTSKSKMTQTQATGLAATLASSDGAGTMGSSIGANAYLNSIGADSIKPGDKSLADKLFGDDDKTKIGTAARPDEFIKGVKKINPTDKEKEAGKRLDASTNPTQLLNDIKRILESIESSALGKQFGNALKQEFQ